MDVSRSVQNSWRPQLPRWTSGWTADTEKELAKARTYAAQGLEPGHDAWVVGDEPVVAHEFESAETYARA